ncbi:MAG: hypothetical protein JRE45_11405 [Deltaproteobacteria bacterium]|nr:hypothetical protein [Deltaproteobacteria bacterium]MBW2628219.1 hypothetical protein [Deltaproteobacteria bacterium]
MMVAVELGQVRIIRVKAPKGPAAELRGVPMGQDVISPPRQLECVDEASTVAFIRRIQEVAGLPVGIKFCLGRSTELRRLVQEMKRQGVFPDFMTVDGAEGGAR